ncbi:MAG: hypothetical protein KA319_03635 [Ferruginibacter sp.]|nr:hypothetical protein [Ferruginibacter sp.]
MKRIIFFLLCICTITITNAQTAKPVAKKTLKKIMEMQMPEGDGANGSCVVYHPTTKKYYIPMIGNASYDLVTFDANGKQQKVQSVNNDLRGLWYNPKTKKIEGNCYADGGWVSYTVSAKGEVTSDATPIHEGSKQPSDQSVGVFNAKEAKVYFLSTTGVSVNNLKAEEEKTIELKTAKDADPIIFDNDNEYYNTTSLIYTGIPKAEIGLLNVLEKRIELFNSATGIKTTEWMLPDSVAELKQSFNFAYCNGMVWLFDKENRPLS